jgi:hypothetical protein
MWSGLINWFIFMKVRGFNFGGQVVEKFFDER